MKIYKLLITTTLAVFASSCNIDETFTAPDKEGHYRPQSADSSMQWSKVVEYRPAPGQFIGDTKTSGFTGTEASMAEAIAYAEMRLGKKSFVSLGGFGGYIAVGFDHSIDNNEGYDFAVQGNAFDGSSEPGIVWVMQDEDGNGEADDTWYELAGSEASAEGTIKNYSVTYFRPTSAEQPVKWVDSEGVEGEIDYLKSYHDQPSYYPTWIAEESYTLTGTRLKTQNYDKYGNGLMWILPAYGWGYVDNYSQSDWLPTFKAVNCFDISQAVDAEGRAVELEYIDFVKVVTACNGKSGHLGEISTEVCDIYDL